MDGVDNPHGNFFHHNCNNFDQYDGMGGYFTNH